MPFVAVEFWLQIILVIFGLQSSIRRQGQVIFVWHRMSWQALITFLTLGFPFASNIYVISISSN